MLFLRCCAALGLLVVGLFFADKRGIFFDLASLAFVLGPTFAAFASVQFKKEGFLVTRGLILQVSIVGILIGFVGMIQHVSDATSIGMATGTALLVVLYASIVVGVCHLFASKNEQQINFNPLPSRLFAISTWVLVTGFLRCMALPASMHLLMPLPWPFLVLYPSGFVCRLRALQPIRLH